MAIDSKEFTKIKEKFGDSGLTVLNEEDSADLITTVTQLDPNKHVILPEDLEPPQGKRLWGIDMYEETRNLVNEGGEL